jgi:hypothetical protein
VAQEGCCAGREKLEGESVKNREGYGEEQAAYDVAEMSYGFLVNKKPTAHTRVMATKQIED